MAEQSVEAGVTAGFIRKRFLLAIISRAAQRISGRTVDSDSHKAVTHRLAVLRLIANLWLSCGHAIIPRKSSASSIKKPR